MQVLQKIINKTTKGPYWVMYDNECSFCYLITRFFKRFDAFNKIQWVPKDWNGDFPSEYREKVEKTVIVYDPSLNCAYYKSEAVYKIITCIPFGSMIAWVLKIPFLLKYYDLVYDKISDNRKRFCR